MASRGRPPIEELGPRGRLRLHWRALGRVIVWTLLASSLLPSIGGSTVSPHTTSDDVPTFVEPPRRPTEVTIAAFLIGLSRVSDPASAFPTADVEMFLDLSWRDPRLAFEGDSPRVFQGEEALERLSEMWSPDPEIQNEVEQRETESVELIVLQDGTVQYEERFGATVNAELDLSRFPLDRQAFEIELQSFLWDSGECVFVVNEAQTGFDRDFETPEWTVFRTEGLLSERSEIRDDRVFSTFTLRIHAQRSAGHYLLRFMLPLLFIMGLTWAAFWMPLEGRFRVGFISLLTVVASHTVIASELPRLHYPTFADLLLFSCYVFATVLILVSIRLQQFKDAGLDERVTTLERRTRWLLPAVAAVAMGVAALVLLRS